MSPDLKLQCENSFLKELYQYDGGQKSLVIDETNGRLYLQKRLKIYSREVYRWISDHPDPHIARVARFYEDGSGNLVVLEKYIQGRTLDAYLEEEKPDEKERRQLFLQLLDALEYLHSAVPPIIHRDVKPSNVMISADGVLKLVDYDAAKIYRKGREQDTVLLGTRGSAAPEQYGFGQSDERTDIYAAGILLKTLFPDDPKYESVIQKAVKLDPEQRYQSPAEMRKAFLKGNGTAFRPDFAEGRRVRSGVFWILSLTMVWFGMTMEFTAVQTEQIKFFDRLFAAFLFLSMVLVGFGWPQAIGRLPGMQGGNRMTRALVKAGYWFLGAIFGFGLIIILTFLLNLWFGWK